MNNTKFCTILCKFVLNNTQCAFGCRKYNCTYSHAPKQHRGDIIEFRNLYDGVISNLYSDFAKQHITFDEFTQWLEFRNANRMGQFIINKTNFVAKEQKQLFDVVIREQLRLEERKWPTIGTPTAATLSVIIDKPSFLDKVKEGEEKS